MSSSLFRLAGLLAAAAFPAALAWPIKTIDPSGDGANCDITKEQYIQVEAYDFHETPILTMTWTQLTGPCGVPVSNPVSWTETYDATKGDKKPNSQGRVQLNLFVCAPFGEYEIELDVSSFTGDRPGLQERTAWELENGEDEYHIWDTVNTNLAQDEAYSPTVPGVYKWPLPSATGFYKKLISGPLPPLQCGPETPAYVPLPNIKYEGCYEDTTLSGDTNELKVQGPEGMTTQRCADFCVGFDYFGTTFGYKCHCGSQADFNAAKPSNLCGNTYEAYCFGNAYETCGGDGGMSIYSRTEGDPAPPSTPKPVAVTPQPVVEPDPIAEPVAATPQPVAVTPKPVETSPQPVEVVTATSQPVMGNYDGYESVGCYADLIESRIMETGVFLTYPAMDAELCFILCNDGVNTHFGTEYGRECFCGINPNLTLNGPMVPDTECSMGCLAATDGETCGAKYRMSAYQMVDEPEEPGYRGCFVDVNGGRVLPDVERYVDGMMSSDFCIAFCQSLGYRYAGTQFAMECWCGNSDDYDRNGELPDTACSMPCSGDPTEMCGGKNAIMVYGPYY